MSLLVAWIDSSTQSCKVVIGDAQTGALVRSGREQNAPGTEVDPAAFAARWLTALAQAGRLDDVAAVSVASQQHGMVCLAAYGQMVRPALLWNDTRSAAAADALIAELGEGDPARGQAAWTSAAGSVPVAALTVTKLPVDGRGDSLCLRRVAEKPRYQRDELALLRRSQRRQ